MAGLTLDYKRGAEYKEWSARIKEEHPTMPEYLVDLAIVFHKTHPRAYKERPCTNCPEKVAEFRKRWAELKKGGFTIPGAVQVLGAAAASPEEAQGAEE